VTPPAAWRPGWPRRIAAPCLLVAVAGLPGCSADGCPLRSTIAGYDPDCESARIAFFADETVVSIPGVDGGSLDLWLPADAAAGDYGGTTGNPLAALVETDAGTWLAETREARLTLMDPTADPVTITLVVDVEVGDVRGTLAVAAIGAEDAAAR
jgi:hypothetical protein